MPDYRTLTLFTRALLVFAALAAALLPGLALAQEVRVAKRMALLIGNEKYTSERTLNTPRRDVAKLAKVFKDDLRFDEVVAKTDLTYLQMKNLVWEFAHKAQAADTVVFYFSGHGINADGKSFLLGTDAHTGDSDPWAWETQGLQTHEVRNKLNDKGRRITLLILDACRDGPGEGKSGTKGIVSTGGGEGLLIAYATAYGKTAKDSSTYADALAAALREKKPLTTQLDFVAETVRKQTDGKQRPMKEGDLDGKRFLLSEYAPSIDPDIDDAAFKRCATAVSVDACQAYVQGYANGKWLEQARNLQAVAKARQAAVSAANIAPVPSLTPASQPVVELKTGEAWKECDVCPEMVAIPAGRFVMGDDKSGWDSEKPAHAVEVKAFMLGKYEVTVAQYLACVAARACPELEWREKGSKYHYQHGSDGHYRILGAALTDEQHPIVGISWQDAKKYVAWLNAKTRGDYRLPSEAEWEYVARAGSRTTWHFGDDEAQLGRYAWYSDNAGGKTHAVGGKQANPWGLHDMHGNVGEWVEDCWHANYQGAPADGSAWLQSCFEGTRVLRGGSLSGADIFSRAANRGPSTPDYRYFNLGLRVARTPR
ncbi:SUMF1/EgtB/PvdO family nonheme iron enzyme [Massilia sp. W12]|uniref:SUMF1/EgtB/PvdO family nonheme iron enzyme n=1 Tax=Massilia sp. W12 TaxID=3126507 RepID=UPI0030CF9C41